MRFRRLGGGGGGHAQAAERAAGLGLGDVGEACLRDELSFTGDKLSSAAAGGFARDKASDRSGGAPADVQARRSSQLAGHSQHLAPLSVHPTAALQELSSVGGSKWSTEEDTLPAIGAAQARTEAQTAEVNASSSGRSQSGSVVGASNGSRAATLRIGSDVKRRPRAIIGTTETLTALGNATSGGGNQSSNVSGSVASSSNSSHEVALRAGGRGGGRPARASLVTSEAATGATAAGDHSFATSAATAAPPPEPSLGATAAARGGGGTGSHGAVKTRRREQQAAWKRATACVASVVDAGMGVGASRHMVADFIEAPNNYAKLLPCAAGLNTAAKCVPFLAPTVPIHPPTLC